MTEFWKQNQKPVVQKSPEEWAREAGDSGQCPDCGGVLRNFAGTHCNHCGKKLRTVTVKHHSGDPCPEAACKGRLVIRTTNPDTDGDGVRTRYFVCSENPKHTCSCEVEAAAVHSRKKL